MESLEIGGLQFDVRRSERRRTFGLTVDRNGELVAYVPATASKTELARWVRGRLLWVHRKLALKAETAPNVRAAEYVSGEAFCYLGRRYRLRLVEKQDEPLKFDGAQFTLQRRTESPEQHFRKWYQRTGAEWLRGRVKAQSRRVTCQPTGIEVRDLGFRWGSCSKQARLLFNWKVLQLPVGLVDYVVVHELVHLKERHHGPAFWKAMGRAMPDWERRKAALAEKAKDYLVFGLAVH